MAEEKKTGKINIASQVISVVLIALLFVLFYKDNGSLMRSVFYLGIACVPVFLTLKFYPESIFRSFAFCLAVLPSLNLSVDLGGNPFDFIGFKALFQVWITYSYFFLIFAPAMALAVLVANKKNPEKKKGYKKYILHAALIILCIIVSAFVNPLINQCEFAFKFLCIAIITDYVERYIYDGYTPVLANLPYFFLALTAIFRIRWY